ncbi:nuclear transport factor 2 family protein [Caldimonas tepidiphila]|uniref:nuclear transport factor 2 family protein n=1 Tax=Caldimonas tepidiphila TaxID=2315841 RepID=UPI001F0C5188|nr:nuclear transport factor 2 family protein [Caldimonas tepidiphila]
MDELERMLAREACRELVLQAALHVDANRPEQFAALFAEDGVLTRPNAQPLRGREAILAAYRQRPADRITRHLVTNTLVTLESDTEARAASYVLLWSGSADAEPGAQGRPAHPRRMVGEFDDRFVLTAEGWRIARREARFVLHLEA